MHNLHLCANCAYAHGFRLIMTRTFSDDVCNVLGVSDHVDALRYCQHVDSLWGPGETADQNDGPGRLDGEIFDRRKSRHLRPNEQEISTNVKSNYKKYVPEQ